MKRTLALVMALTLSACGCATPMAEPYQALPLSQPAWFVYLHRQMLECLERTGAQIERRDYGGIRWFVARPGVMGDFGEVIPWSGEIAGKWSWPDHVILDARFVGHPAVVRHEMGHFILQVGDSAHPVIEPCAENPSYPEAP